MADALTWAGTFHAIGARLLRDYAEQIGIDPAFTIHDREDSADLMSLVRHDLGLSKTESHFPMKGTSWPSTRAPSPPRWRWIRCSRNPSRGVLRGQRCDV